MNQGKSKRTNLKYLLNLIDDEQPGIGENIVRELQNYGLDLEEDLSEYKDILTPEKYELLNPIIDANRKKTLMQGWVKLKFIQDSIAKLEYALRLIVQYQSGPQAFQQTLELLDSLAIEFSTTYTYGSEMDLSVFLFQIKKISGNREDYYDPLNSNLHHAITQKKGIPITLCSLYMLVGNRLNMDITGCGLPGHFLARINMGEEEVYIDCFNGGKISYREELVNIRGISKEAIYKIIDHRWSGTDIIKRVLNNLVNAYNRREETGKADLFNHLITIPI